MRAAYVKVAEYQHRGLVHVHVVIRLDGAMPNYRADVVRAPDSRFTVELLEDALRAAAAAVTVPVPAEVGGGYVTWGAQLDVQHIGTGHALEPGRCASYLAKYATKATEQAGGVLHRVTEYEIDQLAVSEHVKAYLRHAFALDAQLDGRRMARNAHAFGYRGHCLTKSRRYSTTFKQLRADREAHVLEQILARSRDKSQLAIAARGARAAARGPRVRRPGPFNDASGPLADRHARGRVRCGESRVRSSATLLGWQRASSRTRRREVLVGEARESIQALATVTLDARSLESLGPQTLDRLAELVEARLILRRAAGEEPLLSAAAAAELVDVFRRDDPASDPLGRVGGGRLRGRAAAGAAK